MIIGFILIAIIVAVVIFAIKKKNEENSQKNSDPNKSQSNSTNEDSLKGRKYKAKNSLLTPSELDFYEKLQTAFPNSNIQVQQVLYSFIEQEKEYFNQGPKGLFKSVDFLICDDEFKPIVAIELNDKSHRSLDRQERDKFVSVLFERCNIPLVVFETKEELTSHDIKSRIKKVI